MAFSSKQRARVGVVVIGRDEGARLRLCLESIVAEVDRVVYVDSGSRDGSPELARTLGADVIELDASAPFTASRGRNAGFEHLLGREPELEAVQFVDGDCALEENWLEVGYAALTARPELCCVCGILRERHPKASIYHELSDVEWDEPTGEIQACGGVALVRAAALREVGGYDPKILAGEEAEMYLRMRRLGYKLERLAAPMATHDIGMTRFGQWWKRATRAGHAYAEVSRLYREQPFLRWAAKVRSNWFWGALLPLAIALSALRFPLAAAVLSLGYPVLFLRVYRSQRPERTKRLAALHAWFIVLGKFAGALGQFAWFFARLTGRRFAYRKSTSANIGRAAVALVMFAASSSALACNRGGARRPAESLDATPAPTAPYALDGPIALPPASGSAPAAAVTGLAGNPPFLRPTVPCAGDANKPAGAAITLSLEASRAQGVAPLAVFFDASGTKAEGSTRPFQDLAYCWEFGDPRSGDFSTTGQSRNQARGPVAAHVFETPGTYTVKVRARDASGRVAERSVSVTIDDPERVFAGQGTVCFSGAGNFDGCPAGASRVTAQVLSALKGHVQPNRRLLLRRGESFRADAALPINNQGPGIVGAFGKGARPKIISQKSGIPDGPVIDVSHGRRPDASDWRFVDLDFEDPTHGGPLALAVNGRASNLLLLRVRAAALSGGVAAAVDIIDYWRNEGVTRQDIVDGFFIQDSEFSEIEGYTAYVAARRFALLGSGASAPRETRRGSMLRLHWLDRAVISNNDLGPGTGSDGHVLYIPGPGFTQYPGEKPGIGNGQYARRFVISDNVLRPGKHLNWVIYVGCQNMSADERFQEVIIERNFFLPGTANLQAGVALRGWVQNAAVRDNLFLLKSEGQCVVLAPWKHRSVPSPTYLPSDVTIVHNTCVIGGGPLVYMDKRDKLEFSRVFAHNNLMIGPRPHLTEGGGSLSTKDTGNVFVESPSAAGLLAPTPVDWKGLALTGKSTAVDGADARFWSAWDFTGRPRYVGKAPDVGALEYAPGASP
jgi:GT2 family glycosyltransferase